MKTISGGRLTRLFSVYGEARMSLKCHSGDKINYFASFNIIRPENEFSRASASHIFHVLSLCVKQFLSQENMNIWFH